MGEQLPQRCLRDDRVHRARPLRKRVGDGCVPGNGRRKVLSKDADEHRRHGFGIGAEMPFVVLGHRGLVADFSDADGVEDFHAVLGDNRAAERRHPVGGANRFELVVDWKSQPTIGEARHDAGVHGLIEEHR